MSMINARGTTNGSAYAMWSVMLYGTCKQTDHGCPSCPTSLLSLRSQPLSSALLLKNKPREQHECTNLMHSDLGQPAQTPFSRPSRPTGKTWSFVSHVSSPGTGWPTCVPAKGWRL